MASDYAQGRGTNRSARRALTGTDLVAVVVIVLLIVVVIYAAWGYVQKYDPYWGERRTVCAANLSGIAKGLYTYANENDDLYPIVSFDMSNEPEQGFAYIEYVNAIKPALSQSPDALPQKASTTACLWMLVRERMSAPKSFNCPSSTDDELQEVDDPLWIDPMAVNPVPRYDFDSYYHCSYGYQVPFGKVGQPTTSRDARMPLAADKGPFGAALEGGEENPGIDMPDVDAPMEDWRPWNSPNHGGVNGGEGPNVLYADTHVEWTNKPIVGLRQDNIYTGWIDPVDYDTDDIRWRTHGAPPTSNEAPWDNIDTLIYP